MMNRRQRILMEKHSRGSIASSVREERIQGKEKRKMLKSNNIPGKDIKLSLHQYQLHSIVRKSRFPDQGSEVSINSGTSTFQGKQGSLIDLGTSEVEWNQPRLHSVMMDFGFPAQGSKTSFNSGKATFQSKQDSII